MERQRLIDLCDPSEVSAEVYPCEWRPRPGRVFVRMHPTESRNGILLGESSPAKADIATVQKSGVSWLKPGDIVVVRPYCGISMDGLVPGWGKIIGHRRYDSEKAAWMGDSADWDILMILRDGEWHPLNGWQLVARDCIGSGLLLLPENLYQDTGIVERGSWQGRSVAMAKDDNFSLHSTKMYFGLNSPGSEYTLVHNDYLLSVVMDKAV